MGTGCVAVPPPQQSFEALRHKAVQSLAALKEHTALAEKGGVEVARESVTITTAELFLVYAQWDKENVAEVEKAIASWWRAKKDAPRLAKELPHWEMADVIQVLAKARQELAEVMQGKVTRRPFVDFDMTALVEKDGYYRQRGRPVFPSTFVWQPNDEKLNEAYGVIGGKYIHLPHIRAEGEKPDIGYEPDDQEPLGYIFLGQKHAPRWLVKEHPEITDGKHHYTGFDTDHPVARDLWASMLADTVPQFRGRKVSQGGYMLTNEPHWFTCTEGWATDPVSEKTKARFRGWLKERHGNIAALNALWQAEFASFADVRITVPIDAALRGQPVWYDWCRFNMDRITEWFGFLKQEIRRHDPTAQTHIKLIPGHLSRHSRCHGLDFEALVRLQDIIGCDAGVVNVPHWKNKETWPERYACDWRDQALPLDFFRSISPDKVVFDSEWHSLSKSNIRNPRMSGEYARAALWLAHLHGTGMNQTWYWSRNLDGSLSKRSGSAFHASNLAQPLVMDSYGRTMKELNAFSPEVVALAMQPKLARIYYSEASAIQDKAYMDHVYDAYKALYHGGLPLGFVTKGLLAEASEVEMESWPLLVVPHADHIMAGDREALGKYLAQGGTLLVVGANSLKRDEYGRPCAELQAGKGTVRRVPGSRYCGVMYQTPETAVNVLAGMVSYSRFLSKTGS
ncbi:MAG: hypothetical protein HN380_29705, partial [Victivallales bacterium]|nr:hypothetical protein [Victivallales bacterium]